MSVPASLEELDRLPTEGARPDLSDLDARDSAQIVDLLLAAEARVPELLVRAAPALVAGVETVVRALDDGGRLVYVGAGTPGRLAQLDALECVPTFGVEPGRVIAVMAGGERAEHGAFEEGEDDVDAARSDLAARELRARDVVVGVTASGRTPYVVEALRYARSVAARTIAVTNNRPTPVAAIAEIAIEVLTGPEVLAGSTRLSAGTAQKIVLNTLSTAAMVRTGRSFGPWMIDLQPSNEKLIRRARRIVAEVTGAGTREVIAALEDSGQHTRTAIVMLMADVDAEESRSRLEATGGDIRKALAGLGAVSGPESR